MQENKLNFVFFGTPDVAEQTLDILKQGGFLPTLIVTAPDRPAGRKMLLTPPPVKTWAIKNNIPYIQPEKDIKKEVNVALRSIAQADAPSIAIREHADMRAEKSNIDLFLVIAYGKILPEEIIKMPRLGSINIHYSLLPKYRGASPVESAILSGDTETGVAIQQMEYKMDAGPILAEEKTEIGQTETAPELRTRLIKIGADLLVKILPDFLTGKITPIPQDDEQATFCKKIKKEDGLVDLELGNPQTMYNKFRAYKIWPRTYFFRDGKRIIITDAILQDGKFVIKKVIPEGGKEQEYKG